MEGATGSEDPDWPQWLGPYGTGVSLETGLVDSFPEKGPYILWRQALGSGFSSMVSAGTRVYTMYGRDEEYAICLDGKTGKVIWRRQTGRLFMDSQGGDGPRATPAVDGSRLFVLGAFGDAYALDRMTGEVLWRRNLVEDFKGNLPMWGYGASPKVAGSLLLLATGSDREPSLIALDKSNGKLVWATGTGRMGYATPITFQARAHRQVMFFTGSGLEAVDLEKGRALWHYPWKTPWQVNAATPLFIPPDMVFITSSYGMGGALVRIPGKGTSGETVWKEKTLGSVFGTPLFYQGNLYGFDQAVLKCLDIRNGQVLWQRKGLGQGTLIGADGKLIILGEQGQLVIARADSKGYEGLASAQVMSGKCWTAPALAGGRLFLRNERSILAIDLKSP